MKKYWVRNSRGHFYRKPGMRQVRMGETIIEARETYAKICSGEIRLEPLAAYHSAQFQRIKEQMYQSMKNRAARKGFGVMSPEEFERLWRNSGRKCAVTGIRFSAKRYPGKVKRPWGPSIDRLDVTKGYEFHNCRLVCTAVNLAMNEWGEDVLMRLVEALAPTLYNGEVSERIGEGSIFCGKLQQGDIAHATE